jgi:nucleotide-binding universal stress UspA family protein
VENTAAGNRAFCNLNEGLGKVLRFRANSPEVLDRLRWLGTEFFSTMQVAVRGLADFGAHLTLLHVYQDPSYAVEYVLGPDGYHRSLQERIYFEKTLKTTVEGLRKDYADCDSEFRDGAPCKEIVNTAKERDIDLIIISTHHYNWLTRLACGSDAEHILRNMPCPILIFQANTTPGTSMLP